MTEGHPMTALNERALEAAVIAFDRANNNDFDSTEAVRTAIETYRGWASAPDAVAVERELARGLEIGGEIGRCYDGPEGEDARKKMAARFRALTKERDEWREEAARLNAQIAIRARSQP